MFENLDDPRKQALLALAAGLLSPVRGKGWSGFGEAAGQGINAGLLGFNQAQRTQEAVKRGEMERQLEQARLAQMKQAQDAQAYMGQGIGKFMAPGSPGVPYNDSLGDGQQGFVQPPQAPSFDKQGFAQYLAQNPATAREALNFLPQPKDTKYMESAGRIVAIGPDGKAQEVLGAPAPKAKFQAGDIRTYEKGRSKITEEFDGSKWVVKAASQIDKPEDGMTKPPAGYRWRGDGTLEPIPGGPQDPRTVAKVDSDSIKRNEAKARVSELLDNLSGYYQDLNKAGAAVSTSLPARTNIQNRIAASEVGQLVGGAMGTQEQSIRNRIKQSVPLLMNEIRSATGMSAKSMDSNAELQFYLRAATDPTMDVEANLAAIEKLRGMYGLGAGDSKPKESAAPVSINGLSVTVDGKTLTFPNEAALNAFKKQAGL